ncbi:hypothetical protein SAMN04488498_16311, partial [Mesorhizobium albiziae]
MTSRLQRPGLRRADPGTDTQQLVGCCDSGPGNVSFETHLHATMSSLVESEQDIKDGVAAARIVALLAKEPALRAAWLMACSQADAELTRIIAARLEREEEVRARLRWWRMFLNLLNIKARKGCTPMEVVKILYPDFAPLSDTEITL